MKLQRQEKKIKITSSKRKQISFFSSILIVIGSCVGAGIFFKSRDILDFSGGNVIFATIVWIIAAFTVLCLALALIEVSSACSNNLSLIGWCKKFNNCWIYKSCKYYMVYIYLPHMYFALPVYSIMPVLDALRGFGKKEISFGTDFDIIIWTLIIFAIAFYFIFTSGFYSKLGNIQNMICQIGKFLPILIIIGVACVILATTNQVQNTNFEIFKPINDKGEMNMVASITPFIGIFGSLAAIFFAYDGFYESAGVTSEMREPRRVPHSFIWGIGIITILYIMLTLLMSLASKGGNFSGTEQGSFNDWMTKHNLDWLYGVVSLLICLGVLGILNNFTMWAPRYIEDLIREGEVYVPRCYLNRLNPHFPKVGNIFLICLVFPIVTALSIVSSTAYFTTSERANDYGEIFGRFASFADLIGSWTAIFNFTFIAMSVLGAIKNRKTKRVPVNQYKHFLWTGWYSSIVILIALTFSALDPFVNLIIISTQHSWWTQSIRNDQLQVAIGLLLTCILRLVFLFGTLVLIIVEKKLLSKRLKKIQFILEILENTLYSQKISTFFQNKTSKKDKISFLKSQKFTFNQIKLLLKLNWLKTGVTVFKKQFHLELLLVKKAVSSFSN